MDNEQNNTILNETIGCNKQSDIVLLYACKVDKLNDKVSKLTFIVTCKTMTKRVLEQLKDLTKGINCRIIIVETHVRRA